MINDDILAHARQCAPAESCGYVVRTAQGERYFPCENLSAEPTMYFRISPEDYLNARNRGDIVALVHSHPDGKPCLSSADRTLQIQSGLDWWLVCDNRIHKFRCVPHTQYGGTGNGANLPLRGFTTIWKAHQPQHKDSGGRHTCAGDTTPRIPAANE